MNLKIMLNAEKIPDQLAGHVWSFFCRRVAEFPNEKYIRPGFS